MKYLVTLVLLTLFTTALADEMEVYESIDELTIERVFLTPAERRWLDANRGVDRRERRVLRSATDDTVSDDDPAPVSDPPAGFIINSSGGEIRWQRGDFVDVDDGTTRSLDFPGDVRIIRHRGAPSEDADTSEEKEDAVPPQ